MSVKRYVTLGPIGYQKAGGTWASLTVMPLVVFLQGCFSGLALYGVCIVCAAVALMLTTIALPHFGNRTDPSEIVIDEVVGCLITFTGIPLTPVRICIGLILFRVFDITKIGGIRHVEQLPNGWGIVLDDVLAGLYANGILCILYYYYQWI